jgi:hypothetical protein
MQAQCSTRIADTPVPPPAYRYSYETYRYRAWVEQAARLYPTNPTAQRLALLQHLDIKMTLTHSPSVWLWCHDLATHLGEEVAP